MYARMSALKANETPTPGFEPKIVEVPEPSVMSPGPGTSKKPITPKERITAPLISLSAIAVGTAMWIWHQFYVSDLLNRMLGQEAAHRFRLKIDIIWCRPTGAVLILFGCLILLGALTK